MFYLGTAGSCFGWHREDFDLCSLNYLYDGAPKYWWLVPPSQVKLFTAAVKKLRSAAGDSDNKDENDGDDDGNDKTLAISLQALLEFEPSLTVIPVEHSKGEIIVTAPGAPHSGYNGGNNIAESVNFSIAQWADHGFVASLRAAERGLREQPVDIEGVEMSLAWVAAAWAEAAAVAAAAGAAAGVAAGAAASASA